VERGGADGEGAEEGGEVGCGAGAGGEDDGRWGLEERVIGVVFTSSV
jgi:hypothetical protein